MSFYSSIIAEFNSTLKVDYEPATSLALEVERLIQFAKPRSKPSLARQQSLFAAVNAKFRFNAEPIGVFFGECARQKVTFNYHEKGVISTAFDLRDAESLSDCLRTKIEDGDIRSQILSEFFRPITPTQTLERLHGELKSPTLARRDSKPRDWSVQILQALFTAHVCNVVGLKALHAFNTGGRVEDVYEPDFWRYLQGLAPHLHAGEPSLVILRAPAVDERSEDLVKAVASAYDTLSNFGYFAVLLDSPEEASNGSLWAQYAIILLYAEKHVIRDRLSFFQGKDIECATTAHIPGLDVSAAAFDQWNDGFYFQDCFVLGDKPRLLLLFQKCEADETPISCPGCRSQNVQGNSYSSLGVKSWECRNVLCPDKSKFGRGKRYSFVQLLKQAAIEESGNEIPLESLRKWRRDVQPERSDDDILDMLTRHYTLNGDTVVLEGQGWPDRTMINGRHLARKPELNFKSASSPRRRTIIQAADFSSSAFFNRYATCDKAIVETTRLRKRKEIRSLTAYLGDAASVLRVLPPNCVDGAVTSPPYYNAREYSQWSNIYTYLYDMQRVGAAVYRALKPGAYYLYNIFDYFDNENTVVFSAMGKKRLVLGAYTIDLFRRIGFSVEGNIVWDKGDIEGKRGFNGGNPSPYYQSPFNCWEHILVFRKPGPSSAQLVFPRTLKHGAVIKMIRGENVHGHSAPFPEAIPALLAERLPRDSVILDPFAGSMTTAIAAERYKSRSICIERDERYFELGVSRYIQGVEQLALL